MVTVAIRNNGHNCRRSCGKNVCMGVLEHRIQAARYADGPLRQSRRLDVSKSRSVSSSLATGYRLEVDANGRAAHGPSYCLERRVTPTACNVVSRCGAKGVPESRALDVNGLFTPDNGPQIQFHSVRGTRIFTQVSAPSIPPISRSSRPWAASRAPASPPRPRHRRRPQTSPGPRALQT